VVSQCQRLWQRWQWHGNGNSGRGGHGDVNGPMAKGAQGECGQSKGVRGCAQLNTHAAVQGQKRSDIFRVPRGGSKSIFDCSTWELGGERAGNI